MKHSITISQVPDPTGASAVWVAQRVPDNHLTVVANTFVIRHVDPDSPDFMYSSNLWSVAEHEGWWSPKDGLLDFLVTYAPERYHPNYSNRRCVIVRHHTIYCLLLTFNISCFFCTSHLVKGMESAKPCISFLQPVTVHRCQCGRLSVFRCCG